MFELASGYRDRGMAAYSELQQKEFAREKDGYTCERAGAALARRPALLTVCSCMMLCLHCLCPSHLPATCLPYVHPGPPTRVPALRLTAHL